MIKYIPISLIFIIISCATANHQERLNTLEAATFKYGIAVRWGHFELANSFRKREAVKQTDPDFSMFSKIKITSYEILSREFSKDYQQAMQNVELRYYFLNNMIEKTLIDRQIWEYDPAEKNWYLKSLLPNFE